MSDWIPVPEFENVLIVLADLAETPEDIVEAPVWPMLQELKGWQGGTVYLFHDPPEAGEVLEDADPEMAAQFALAAQMTDMPAEAVRDALRRVFSRSVVQRVLVMRSTGGGLDVSRLDEIFSHLASADLVWGGEWPGEFVLGMKQYHGEIFSDLNGADSDLKKAVQDAARQGELSCSEVELR